MDYEKTYSNFYSKYYLKSELLIKSFFIKSISEKRTFGYSSDELRKKLAAFLKTKFNLHNNQELTMLHQVFKRRHSFYAEEEIQYIFKNEIKTNFDKINNTELLKYYDFSKFIKEIAIIEALEEISRLVLNNNRLLEIFYKLNDFEKFEIKEYSPICIENTSIYKELSLRLYPKVEKNKGFEDNEDYEEYNDIENNFHVDLSFQLAILEKIMKIENWDDLNANKKGEILTFLLGKSKDNIKKYYNHLTRKSSDTKGKFYDKEGKFYKDKLKAEEVINKLLG